MSESSPTKRRIFIAGQFTLPTGAPASRVRNLALGLAGHGLSVHVLPAAAYGEASYDGWQSGAGAVTVDRPIADPNPYGRLSNTGTLERINWLRREVRRFRSLAARFAALHPKSGDVLILYGRSYSRLAPLFRLARREGLTIVWDIVESGAEIDSLWGPRAILRWDTLLGLRLARRANAVSAITTGLAALYEPFTRVCHLPGMLSWSSSPPVASAPSKLLSLLYIGALIKRDAPALLVEMMRRCSGLGLPVRMTIAGRFDISPAGRQWAEAIKVDPALATNTRLVASPSDEELRQLRASADALILLRANTPAEALSFPTRVVENLQFGKPVITTAVGDLPLFLRHGADAYVVPPDSVDALVEVVEELVAANDRGSSIGRQGFETGRRNFDRSVLTRRLLETLALRAP